VPGYFGLSGSHPIDWFYLPHKTSFSTRDIFLISISRFNAADRSAQDSLHANRTGVRVRVYFDAVPALCAARRLSGSLVMPQYKVSSAQRRR